jgi:uncharacterized membrane protein YgdD (TMEM256/DUF423 family)
MTDVHEITKAESPTRLFFLRLAAPLGATGVLFGAFAAHVLSTRLSDDMLSVFEIGVRYHLYHALALLAVSVAPATWWNRLRLREVAWAWIAGIVVFSGSLYLLALTELKWLGMITPVGGLALVAGWLLLAAPQRPR